MGHYSNGFLAELYMAGKPLLEIGIYPAEGADIREIQEVLHAMAPDIELRRSRYGGNCLEGDATAEAMKRLFGFELLRVNIRRWDAARKCYDGVYPDGYMWETLVDWNRAPPELKDRIARVGFSQPGTNDDGGLDAIQYDLPPAIYEVTRMDDHGRSFLIATVFRREDADDLVQQLEARAHKQTYFIAQRAPLTLGTQPSASTTASPEVPRGAGRAGAGRAL